MNIQFARLCIFYEDLRLEFAAAGAEDIPLLDRIGRDPRPFYFVRRTLATLERKSPEQFTSSTATRSSNG